jgi:hypothetical protein
LSGPADVRSVHQCHRLAVDPLSDRSQAQPRQGQILTPSWRRATSFGIQYAESLKTGFIILLDYASSSLDSCPRSRFLYFAMHRAAIRLSSAHRQKRDVRTEFEIQLTN